MRSIFYLILFFLVFFLTGFYAYYRYKISKIHPIDYRLYKLYPKDIILKTGGRLQKPQQRFQHFLNFSTEKKKKVIRIGAFGDSHTYGNEVGKTATYPYYLQTLFDINYPNRSIEVLNFGVGGSGFPEQFFLWEKYAKVYQLDYILLGPGGFRSIRNTNFNYFSPQYIKNRFIITEKDSLREVHIKGDSFQERFKNYYSLIPSGTALRYDKRPFKIYEILFPFLKYKIKNPFYYTKMSEHEEAVKINKRLLEEINKVYPRKTLFFLTDKWLYNLYKPGTSYSLSDNYNPSSTNLYNLNQIIPAHSFYKKFHHNSSLGNEFTAWFYFNALLG
ncbi:MAG: SGNH/GDSL hydrolase family protein, partial [Oligoflexia bacterium]|nr:SGNH/GDSL hydrolase family protein [Oligoflexia bacterium]